MKYKGEDIDFPAVVKLSFFKVIESLDSLKKSTDKELATYAQDLINEVNKYPELLEGITDVENLEKYKPSIEKFGKFLFPEALLTNEIKALTPPFQFMPLYLSTRFQNIIKDSDEGFTYEMKNVDADTFYLYCCYFILSKYYGYPVNSGSSIFMDIYNKTQGLTRKYKVLINADLLDFEPTEHTIDISIEKYELLMDNFRDLNLWKKHFPPNSWIMKGLCMVNLVDFTNEESIRSITETLLAPGEDAFSKLENGIRAMLNNKSVDLGVMMYENDKLVFVNKEETKSIILSSGESIDLSVECTFTNQTVVIDEKPLIISDVDRFHKEINSNISKRLSESDYKSFILAPLIHNEEKLGFIEFGSKERYDMNAATFESLESVIPILSMAQQRFIIEGQNQVEAVIQQECTTIHPSVKWKFEEEANKFINMQLRDEHPVFKDIIFKDLYPLYGQMDIKGSSTKRNKAVAEDLTKQINGVNKVLKAAYKLTSMPIYDELIFRLDQFLLELEEGLSAGSEHNIMTFLKVNVYPAFGYLEKNEPSLHAHIQKYSAMLDEELMTVYEARKRYDSSVNLINQKLASFLDTKQVQAQAMFPHFFERYKTDGVEYNIYIGQSITKEKVFDIIHLKNLRLWQLIVMCEMENEYKRIQEELHTDIELSSLILVHNTPISVHFRMDEKQFDVEGAYNARYEIIKKRVDKAHIRGTKERITQPKHIAIVYSQEQEAAEYRDYLGFLVGRGLIKSKIEDHALEDLQGVTGLRALRVQVSYDSNLTVEEFMESIEEAN